MHSAKLFLRGRLAALAEGSVARSASAGCPEMVLDTVKVYRKAAGPDRAVESVPAQAAAQAKAGAYILGRNLRYRE